MSEPTVDEMVNVIAAKIGKPPALVATALLQQADELGLSEDQLNELVRTQYNTALEQP